MSPAFMASGTRLNIFFIPDMETYQRNSGSSFPRYQMYYDKNDFFKTAKAPFAADT
jgi:hypothetical protein